MAKKWPIIGPKENSNQFFMLMRIAKEKWRFTLSATSIARRKQLPFFIAHLSRASVVMLLFTLPMRHAIHAQAFQKTHIRDIAEMSNNWGNAVADYDQDGDLDIFIVAYDSFRSNKPKTWSRLLKNNGSGWFEDVTIEAGFRQQYSSNTVRDNKLGAAWGDFDNDGYPDLLLTHSGHIQLYQNNKDGSFRDITQSSNITSCPECVNASALWWDYDKDGYLDLYISDYQNNNRLFKNLGNGSFVNATTATRLGDPGSTWCSIPIDANRDGWMDLYVINDYGQSKFYLNKEGQYFEEATIAHGLRNTGNGMGATIGDYNNDGHFDIYITNIAEFQVNALFTGSETGIFQDQNEAQQVGMGHWGWGTRLFDADHDGDEDIYVVNGFDALVYPNKFFKNMAAEGSPHFIDWSNNAATNGEAHGMGVEVFDYDEDGDLDLLVSNTNGAPYLYQNIGRAAHSNWLQVELEGTVSNRNAFGAIVKACGNGRSYYRFHYGAGIMSQSITPVHFGLGDLKTLDSLVITWPNSPPETLLGVEANQKITVTEQANLTTATKDLDRLLGKKTILEVTDLHPNPFHEFISIDLKTEQAGLLQYQIHTVTGQLIWQGQKRAHPGENPQVKWFGEDKQGKRQPPGLYIYTIRLGENQLSGKIILQ